MRPLYSVQILMATAFTVEVITHKCLTTWASYFFVLMYILAIVNMLLELVGSKK